MAEHGNIITGVTEKEGVQDEQDEIARSDNHPVNFVI